VRSLLRTGSPDIISLAKDFLEKSPGGGSDAERTSSAYSPSFALYLYLIPYEKGLEMVLEAAQMYFDSSSNYADPDIELSKACLSLLQNTKNPTVAYIFDLIDAVKLLNKDFQLNILPYAGKSPYLLIINTSLHLWKRFHIIKLFLSKQFVFVKTRSVSCARPSRV
jgi:hypothetical protein